MVSSLKCSGGKPHPYYTRASRADAGDHKGPLPPSTPRSPLRITRPPACLRGFSLPEVDAYWGDASGLAISLSLKDSPASVPTGGSGGRETRRRAGT